MIIRIFLSNSVYFLKSIDSTKLYSIFGKIIHDDNEENVSIFIVDVKESNSKTKYQYQSIGFISKNNVHNVIPLQSDFIKFGVDESKSTLTLNTIHSPTFISTEKTFQTQIFLYDTKTFTELSQRIDEQQWCLRLDPISQLLILIKNQKLCQESVASNQKPNLNCFIPILLSLSIFTQTKFVRLNSAFFKHFQFWTTNFEKFYQNR